MKPTKALFTVTFLAAATLPTRATSLPSPRSSPTPTSLSSTANAQLDLSRVLAKSTEQAPTIGFLDEKRAASFTKYYLKQHGAELPQDTQNIITCYLTNTPKKFLHLTCTEVHQFFKALAKSQREAHQRYIQLSRNALACSSCSLGLNDPIEDRLRHTPPCIFCAKLPDPKMGLIDLFKILDHTLLGLNNISWTQAFDHMQFLPLIGPYAGFRNRLVDPVNIFDSTTAGPIPHTYLSEKTCETLSKVFEQVGQQTEAFRLIHAFHTPKSSSFTTKPHHPYMEDMFEKPWGLNLQRCPFSGRVNVVIDTLEFEPEFEKEFERD